MNILSLCITNLNNNYKFAKGTSLVPSELHLTKSAPRFPVFGTSVFVSAIAPRRAAIAYLAATTSRARVRFRHLGASVIKGVPISKKNVRVVAIVPPVDLLEEVSFQLGDLIDDEFAKGKGAR